MSEQVYETGKIKLVEKKPNETLEEQCKRILEEHNKDTELDFYDSYVEMFNDEFYYEYVILEDNIYKVIELNDSDYNNIYELYDNKDGTMNYVLSYYNGGESFDEAIKEAYERMKDND
mgnify:CR=1 FL=1